MARTVANFPSIKRGIASEFRFGENYARMLVIFTLTMLLSLVQPLISPISKILSSSSTLISLISQVSSTLFSSISVTNTTWPESTIRQRLMRRCTGLPSTSWCSPPPSSRSTSPSSPSLAESQMNPGFLLQQDSWFFA